MKKDKRPSMQFYPGDWRKDPAIQSLDYETRGIWFELICFMWESEERGKLVLNGRPMTDETIAILLGISETKWKQTLSKLLANGVAKLEANGKQNESKIICRRMVQDEAERQQREHLREIRAEAGRRGGQAKRKQNGSKPLANPQANGNPSSSSSSSSISFNTPPSPPGRGDADRIFDHWLTHENLTRHRDLTDDMRNAIKARLRRGYSVEQVKAAITHYAKLKAAGTAPGWGNWSITRLVKSRDYFDALMEEFPGFTPHNDKPRPKTAEEIRREVEARRNN